MTNWQNQLSTISYQLPVLSVTRLDDMDDALEQAVEQVKVLSLKNWQRKRLLM